MNCKSVVAILALASVGLSACEGGGQRVNSKICTPFPKVAASTTTLAPSAPGAIIDAASPVDDCLHRWAYSLAPSADPADAVAEATVAACASALSRWNQQAIGQPAASDEVQALSLTTGQPTNAVAEHYAFAQSRAMFFVVQARAGRCPAPPPPETTG
jgi:hypothetical protein